MRFGERLGTAFQIADDLLDLEGQAAVMGKATGKDEGKATLVSVLGARQARVELARLEAEAIALLKSYGAEAEHLRAAVGFVVRRQA
jgi:farnesyl diphosphate synthase